MNIERPQFDFTIPIGYDWLKDACAINYHPFSPLQPWYYTNRLESFELSTEWKDGQEVRLVVFASRQDTDDIACFVVRKREAIEIAEVHVTGTNRFEITAIHQTFWDWLKAIVDDIALFAEVAMTAE